MSLEIRLFHGFQVYKQRTSCLALHGKWLRAMNPDDSKFLQIFFLVIEHFCKTRTYNEPFLYFFLYILPFSFSKIARIFLFSNKSLRDYHDWNFRLL